MNLETNIIKKAEFNPQIKTYILIVISFLFLISIIGIPLLIIWFLGLGQYMSKRYYDSLECRLTERHLEFKKGVFFKVEKTIPLENIQNLTFIENPLLKHLDLRILKIETAAAQSRSRRSDMTLIGIINSSKFKNQVLEQREILQNANQSNQKSTDYSAEKTNLLLEDIRDILNDIKKNSTNL